MVEHVCGAKGKIRPHLSHRYDVMEKKMTSAIGLGFDVKHGFRNRMVLQLFFHQRRRKIPKGYLWANAAMCFNQAL